MRRLMMQARTQEENQLKQRLLAIIPAVLALITFSVLIFNLPSAALWQQYTEEAILYALLTFFVLSFGVVLSEGTLSPAHVVGIIAFLSLPEAAIPLMLWTVAIGGLTGAMARVWRQNIEQGWWYPLQRGGFMMSRVVLSFYAAGQVYIALQGALPLSVRAWTVDQNATFILIIYALVYITLYFAVFVLELYVRGHGPGDVIKSNLLYILVVLGLPVPFAVLSAGVSDGLPQPLQIVAIFSLVIVVIGLHALSRSEHRLRRQIGEFQTLSVVTRAMRSHLNQDALLRTIYLQISHVLDIDNFTVGLYDHAQGRLTFPLVIRAGQEIGLSPIGDQISDHDLMLHVLNKGTPLLISHDVDSVAQQMNLRPPKDAVYSWLGVPLIAGTHRLGILIITSTRSERRFHSRDLRLLNVMAGSASIAIENALLYEQQTERVERVKALNSVSALLSGTLLPETVLDTVISSASAVDQANAVSIYLFNEKSGEQLKLVRSAGLSTHLQNNLPEPLLQSETSVPHHLKMPMAVNSVMDDFRSERIRDLLIHENKRAFVELPLVIGERSLGLLVLYYNEIQRFDGERLELLRTFATQAAQAIDNARTYADTDEALQRSLEQLLTLAGIGRLLASTVDLKAIGDLILNSAMQATHVNVGLVVLSEPDDKLDLLASYGYPEAAMDDALWLADSIGEVKQSEEITQRKAEAGQRAQLMVPIRRNQALLGVIQLESEHPDGFSDDAVQFVEQIANQAVIAIDNARLFARITEGRDRLQIILNTMEEAIILIDLNGKISLANFRVELLGLEIERLQNCLVTDLLNEPGLDLAGRLGFDTKRELEKLVQDLRVPGVWKSQASQLYMLKDGLSAVHIQRYIIPVPDEDGQTMGALMVFYNKTEEQELQRTREEISRMIVHDLRSPLTAVTTSLKLLRELVPKDSDIYPLIESTTDASRQAIRKLLFRVDSMLDISKMESGRMDVDPTVADLANLADNICVELSPLAHDLDITITVAIDPGLPLLHIDADKVERLLVNLVDNALKYSPANSEVIIRASVHQQVDTTPGMVRAEVIDRGPGVPEEYKRTLFNRYMQIEGRRKVRRGVGLGLTFCKLVAEAHGGNIWIEDNPGGGSIFAFTLPIANLPQPEVETSAAKKRTATDDNVN